ncbi:MAG: hypothetical protein ABFD08_16955 [Syntrophomonas sp.]
MADIQETLEKYKDLLNYPDLFSIWEEEISLRHQARQSDIKYNMNLKGETDELDFLFRSLYFTGDKNRFNLLLISNLQNFSVLQWLMKSPPWVRQDFFEFIPWYINNNRVAPQKLQFLVNIYNEQNHQAFLPVVNVLTLESCNYLLSRTANPALRELFRRRQQELLENSLQTRYGIKPDQGKNQLYPTLFGDKASLLFKTLEQLQSASSRNFSDPYGADRFHLLLQAAETLFQAGLVEDSLVLIRQIYDDYQQKNRLVESLEDKKIYKRFYKLLRRAVPVYVLLIKPLQAGSYALEIYNNHFPLVEADINSLNYLYLYESIIAATHGESEHFLLELLYKASRLTDQSGNAPLLSAAELKTGVDANRLVKLQVLFEQRLSALPHEALVIMELIRFLQFRALLLPTSKLATALLSSYVTLWKWIPSPLFFRAEIFEQLSALADKSICSEARRLAGFLDGYQPEKFELELLNRPELFRKRSEYLRREFFTGKYMGVL